MAGVAFTIADCRRCDRKKAPMRSVCGLCLTCAAEVRDRGHRKFYSQVWRVDQVVSLPPTERERLWVAVRKHLVGSLGRATLAEWLGLDLFRVNANDQTVPTIVGAIRISGYIAFVEARREGGVEYPLSPDKAIAYVSEAHAAFAAIPASEQAPERASRLPRTRKARTAGRSRP